MSSHMTIQDRYAIKMGLDAGCPLAEIASNLGKDRSTISREIRKHRTEVDKGAPYRIKNRCVKRSSCNKHCICMEKPDCTRKCATCSRCNENCPDFVEEHCEKLAKAPYVCNGCSSQSACVLMKQYYQPEVADLEYRETLSQARAGYNMTTLELRRTDEIVSPLLKQGQSIHHICVHNNDALTVSESTLSRLIKDRQLTATVLDQPRVCKLKPRKKARPAKKVDRHCREGRTIEDFRTYMREHPELIEVQMDSVIGRVGGKSLLTLIFPSSELMLAFLCDCHTAACIQSKIDCLYEGLQADFLTLFPVLLTDNGSEFSNPSALEKAADGTPRTRVFYCDPMASWQKPQVERNHEFIRMILPKGSSFDALTQQNIGKVMSHINSYSRPSLGDKTPFEVFSYMFGEKLLNDLLRLSCQSIISPDKIILKPTLLK